MLSVRIKRFATVAGVLGTCGTVATITMSSALAAVQEVHLSSDSGPPGTSVTITVTDCNKVNVAFTDGSINEIIPGNVTGVSQNPNLPVGNFTGSYVIPANASAGPARVVATCGAGVPGASYTTSFTVTSAQGSTTAPTPSATGRTGTTPTTSGSSSSSGSGSQVSRIPSGPAQTGGGSTAGGTKFPLALGGGSVMLTGGAMAALAYRRRSAEAAS